MLNVNLIEHRQERVAQARRRFIAHAMAVCAGFVGLGFMILEKGERELEVRLAEDAALDQERRRVQTLQAQERIASQRDQASRQRRQAEDAHRREGLVLAQNLVDLLAGVPDGVRLDRVEIKERQATVTGRAVQAGEVARFIEVVERSGTLSGGAGLNALQTTPEGAVRFQVGAALARAGSDRW